MATNTILIIDDDSMVARFVTFRLAKKGYNVHHVDNGIDGLETIRNLKPDLVILDMMMPGLDGRELAEQVKENNLFDLKKIIVLTGKNDTDEMKSLFKLGIHDYLQKPFNVDDLIVRIERALELSQTSTQ